MVKGSLITREQLTLALERQVIYGGRIGTNLVEAGIIREADLASFLGRHFRIPSVSARELGAIDVSVIGCITRELAEKYRIIPFRKERKRLHVAMLDPSLIAVIDEIRFVTGYDIIPHVVTELRLLQALEKYYGTKRDLRYVSIFGKEEEEDVSREENPEYLRKVKEQFAGMRHKEEIIGLLLQEGKRVARRVAIFVNKNEQFHGWKAQGLDVEGMKIHVGTPSIFTEVVNRKAYYRGPLLGISGNRPLIDALSGTPQDCILIPIQIREKIVALLYADNGNAAVLDSTLMYLHTLAKLASLAFEIVIIRSKILSL